MKASQIASRDFTYVQAAYPGLEWHEFVIGTPSKPEASARALAYARARWGEPDKVFTYPRKYVKDARVAFAAGRHD